MYDLADVFSSRLPNVPDDKARMNPTGFWVWIPLELLVDFSAGLGKYQVYSAYHTSVKWYNQNNIITSIFHHGKALFTHLLFKMNTRKFLSVFFFIQVFDCVGYKLLPEATVDVTLINLKYSSSAKVRSGWRHWTLLVIVKDQSIHLVYLNICIK